jgi:DoxX-like family
MVSVIDICSIQSKTEIMKLTKIIYWVFTGLFSLMTLAGAAYYFVGYDDVANMFTSLGFSTAIIYPLAIAKILGVVALLSNMSKLLKKMAYLGFAVDLTLAVIAHISVGDGGQGGAIMALLLVMGSIFFDWRLGKKAKLKLAA